MRKPVKHKRVFLPDPIYNSVLITRFLGHLIKRGKKSVAQRILYNALKEIEEKTKTDAIEIFDKALKNTSPLLEVRPRRVGGATYQVPREVKGDRKSSLAIRWILEAARSAKGRSMEEKLAQEIIAAANNEGGAVKKKNDMHKLAEANRAFAHFAW